MVSDEIMDNNSRDFINFKRLLNIQEVKPRETRI